MNENGFVKLDRRFFLHEFWQEERVFSRAEAWLDLIRQARFTPGPAISLQRGRKVTYRRGEIPLSIRCLSARWGWGEKKVRGFLSLLKERGAIAIDTAQGVSVISLTRYDFFNPYPKKEDTVPATENDTAEDTPAIPDNQLKTNKLPGTNSSTGHTPGQVSDTAEDSNIRKNKKERKNTDPLFLSHSERFRRFKEELLRDTDWQKSLMGQQEIKQKIQRQSLSGILSRFLCWIVSIGEENTLCTLCDVKRRFIYWLKKQNDECHRSTTAPGANPKSELLERVQQAIRKSRPDPY